MPTWVKNDALTSKPIPYPVAHTHVAHLWEYSPPPREGQRVLFQRLNMIGREGHNEQKAGAMNVALKTIELHETKSY